MNLANEKCHLRQIKDSDEMIQHLFFKYHSAQTRKKNNKRGHVVLSTPFVPFVY